MANNTEKLRTKLHRELPLAHPIKEHPIDKCEEFVKKLYIDMLCVIAQYENSDTEFALNFVQRIMAGAEMKEPVTEHVKNAMEITEERFGEFLRQCRENKLENIFVMDAMLVSCADGKPNVKQVEFITEIAETLGITKQKTEILGKLVISILEQNSDTYRAAHNMIADKDRFALIMDIICYLKDFVEGLLLHCKDIYWFYSKEPFEVDCEAFYKLDTDFEEGCFPKTKKLVFENLVVKDKELKAIELYLGGMKDIQFIGCEFHYTFLNIERFTNLEFRNCRFLGYGKEVLNGVLDFRGFYNGKIVFENTVFSDYLIAGQKKLIMLEKIQTLVKINGCEFSNLHNRETCWWCYAILDVDYRGDNAKPNAIMTDSFVENCDSCCLFNNFDKDSSSYSNCKICLEEEQIFY